MKAGGQRRRFLPLDVKPRDRAGNARLFEARVQCWAPRQPILALTGEIVCGFDSGSLVYHSTANVKIACTMYGEANSRWKSDSLSKVLYTAINRIPFEAFWRDRFWRAKRLPSLSFACESFVWISAWILFGDRGADRNFAFALRLDIRDC